MINEHDRTEHDARVAGMASPDGQSERGEDVQRADVRHLVAVVWKWRTLVIAGVVFIVAATYALVRLSPPSYTASETLVFDQPAIVASGAEGLNAAQKLLNLMPTYSAIATSDVVLNAVRNDTQTSATISDLRRKIKVEAVEKQLAVQITVHDENANVAERLTDSTARAFTEAMSRLQSNSQVPPPLRYVITPLQRAHAERPARHDARTVALAGILGLAVMSGIAFLLEYIEAS